jgi:Cation transporter/ATPase, N-terminus
VAVSTPGMNYFYRGLKTDPVRGIDSSSIADRIAMYGTNEIPSDPPASSLLISQPSASCFTKLCKIQL